MLRRAAISLLILLTGTGAALAAPLDPAVRNEQFQPGATKQVKILRPSQSTALRGETRKLGTKVQKITPVLSLPSRVEIGRSTLRTPADAAVRPAVAPAGGGS